jgi:hypothetical protein
LDIYALLGGRRILVVVRVKLRIVSKSGKEFTTSALVNSGFEAETPQLLLPRSLAYELGLWPPPPEAILVEVGTAGGPCEELPNP